MILRSGTEVIRQILCAGRTFGLRPEAGWDALECLYLLQGSAIWENGRRTVTLGPGDSLSGRPVQEPCILTAVTELVVLYVCSRPSFHLMSSELANLLSAAVAVEQKDGYTPEHCQRIQNVSAMVGKELGLDPARHHNLLYGSLLHDLGKVGVPDAILKKPGKLTSDEWPGSADRGCGGHMEGCGMHRIVLTSALALFLLTGTALADYQQGQDITVSATVAPQVLQTSGNTGASTFAAPSAALPRRSKRHRR